jgi:hypothetical protein
MEAQQKVNSFRRCPRNVVAPLSKKQYLDAVHRGSEGCFQWLAGVIGFGVFGPDLLEWALLHADGTGYSRGQLDVFNKNHPDAGASFHMAAQMIQEMLSHQGALKLLLSGPNGLCNELRKAFLPGGKYAVDQPCMVTLEVEIVSLFYLPPIRTTQLSDVNFNEGAHHYGPSQQLFTAFASMASAKRVPCSLASTKHFTNDQQELHARDAVKRNDVTAGSFVAKLQGNGEVCSDVEADSTRCSSEGSRSHVSSDVESTSSVVLRSSEPAPLRWTPILPLPPLMLEADALCVRSTDQGCCVTTGVQVASSISCFSGILREIWEEKKETQPIVMQPHVTSTTANHKTVSAAAPVPLRTLKLKPVSQPVALDTKVLKLSDQDNFGRKRRPWEERTLELPEEFQSQEHPRDNMIYSCYEQRCYLMNDFVYWHSSYNQSDEQLSSNMFKERVTEFKKRAGGASASYSKASIIENPDRDMIALQEKVEAFEKRA